MPLDVTLLDIPALVAKSVELTIGLLKCSEPDLNKSSSNELLPAYYSKINKIRIATYL